jgi:leader peptidase (prepilin peptidase)/N-methyltransferase
VVVIGFFFLLGIIIGSFLNVCIARIPEGLSIVSPASRCPNCGNAIKAYDNVPVFGWLWLGGKCRACKHPISAMYVEFGMTQTAIKWLFFTCLIIVLTVTDLRVRILPDLVNWPGLVVGLFFSLLIPIRDEATLGLSLAVFHRAPPPRFMGLLDAVLGALFGSMLLWGAAALYKVVRGREGMGLGEVKMMAMVGAFRGAFLTILLGTLLGSLVGVAIIVVLYFAGWQRELAVRASRRGLGKVDSLRWAIASQYQLPLGTFLGVAALVVVYALPAAVNYLSTRLFI